MHVAAHLLTHLPPYITFNAVPTWETRQKGLFGACDMRYAVCGMRYAAGVANAYRPISKLTDRVSSRLGSSNGAQAAQPVVGASS